MAEAFIQNDLYESAQNNFKRLLEVALSTDINSGPSLDDPEILQKLQDMTNAMNEPLNNNYIISQLLKDCSEGNMEGVESDLCNGYDVNEIGGEGETALICAINANNYDLVDLLLKYGADANLVSDKADSTALMDAANLGHSKLVELLLTKGANPDYKSPTNCNTALHYAACGGHLECCRLLLQYSVNYQELIEQQNENGHTALMEAATSGSLAIINFLLISGAQINTASAEFKETALTLASYKGYKDIVKLLLEAGADHEHRTDEMHTALMEAAMEGHVDAAEVLLDYGAQVNLRLESYETPLTLAACSGHTELVSLLLWHGADPEETNDESYTPLMEASREGHLETVLVLCSACQNTINRMTDETQETALTLAACGGFTELVLVLTNQGADLELGSATPLMEAAQEGHTEVVRLLLNLGANCLAKNASGETAIHLASDQGHTEVLRLLIGALSNWEDSPAGDMGRTSLMRACWNGHLSTVQLLVENGANYDRLTSQQDHTSLSLACANGHYKVVEYLLQVGADATINLKDNSTVLIEASRAGHSDVMKLLLGQQQLQQQHDKLNCDIHTSTVGINPLISQDSLISTESQLTYCYPQDTNILVDNCETDDATISNNQQQNVLSSSSFLFDNSTLCHHQHQQTQQQHILVSDSAKSNDNNFLCNLDQPKLLQSMLVDYSLPNAFETCLSSANSLCNNTNSNNNNSNNITIDNISNLSSTNHSFNANTVSTQSDILYSHIHQINNNICFTNRKIKKARHSDSYIQHKQLQQQNEIQLKNHNIPHQSTSPCSSQSSSSSSYSSHSSSSSSSSSAHSECCTLPIPISTASNNFNDSPLVVSHSASSTTTTSTTINFNNNNVSYCNSNYCVNQNKRTHSSELDLQNHVDYKDSNLSHSPNNFSLKSTSNPKNIFSTNSNPSTSTSSSSNLLQKPDHKLQRDPILPINMTHSSNGIFNYCPTKLGICNDMCCTSCSTVNHNLMKPITKQVLQPKRRLQQQQQHSHQHYSKVQSNINNHVNLTTQNIIGQPRHKILAQSNNDSSDNQCCDNKIQFQSTTNQYDLLPCITSSSNNINATSASTSLNNHNLLNKSSFSPPDNQVGVNLNGINSSCSSPQIDVINNTIQSSLAESSTSHTVTCQPIQSNMSLSNHISDNNTNSNNIDIDNINKIITNNFNLDNSLSTINFDQATCLLSRTSNETELRMGQMKNGVNESHNHDDDNTNDEYVVADNDNDDNRVSEVGGREFRSNMKVKASADDKNMIQCNLHHHHQQQQHQKYHHHHHHHSHYQQMRTKPISSSGRNRTNNQSTSSSSSSSSANQQSLNVNVCTESSQESPLSLACAGGHLEVVRLLLANGARVEHRDKKSYTPLHIAALNGHSQVLSMLVEQGGAMLESLVERTKETALSIAAQNGREVAVRELIRLKANLEHRNLSDYTPLSLSASNNHVGVVRLLLDAGAEINSRSNSRLGISPLMLAAMNGHTEVVRLLLERGSDVNAHIETNRNSALTLACFQGRHEVVQLLVDRNANLEHRAKSGLTPLMEAAAQGHVNVGRVLLEVGADPNSAPVQPTRDTALMLAADKGHTEFVALLLHYGASTSPRNKRGDSALWLASASGHLDCVRLLLRERGNLTGMNCIHNTSTQSDISTPSTANDADNRNITCLMAAFKRGHIDVVRELVDYVTQFPSEQDCQRHVKSLRDIDEIKKCETCKDIILRAKERQEREAAKNAKDLLKEVEEERKKEEQREVNRAKKREKKKAKKKAKQEERDVDNSGIKLSTSDENSKSNEINKNNNDDCNEQSDYKPYEINRVKSSNNTNNISNNTQTIADYPSSSNVNKKIKETNTITEEAQVVKPIITEKKIMNGVVKEKINNTVKTKEITSSKPVNSVRNEFNTSNNHVQQPLEYINNTASKSSNKSNWIHISHNSNTNNSGKSSKDEPPLNVTINNSNWQKISANKRKLDMPINKKDIGKVIGQGGVVVNAIRSITSAHIDIDSTANPLDERIVHLKGSSEAVINARQIILLLVDGRIGGTEIVKQSGTMNNTTNNCNQLFDATSLHQQHYSTMNMNENNSTIVTSKPTLPIVRHKGNNNCNNNNNGNLCSNNSNNNVNNGSGIINATSTGLSTSTASMSLTSSGINQNMLQYGFSKFSHIRPTTVSAADFASVAAAGIVTTTTVPLQMVSSYSTSRLQSQQHNNNHNNKSNPTTFNNTGSVISNSQFPSLSEANQPQICNKTSNSSISNLKEPLEINITNTFNTKVSSTNIHNNNKSFPLAPGSERSMHQRTYNNTPEHSPSQVMNESDNNNTDMIINNTSDFIPISLISQNISESIFDCSSKSISISSASSANNIISTQSNTNMKNDPMDLSSISHTPNSLSTITATLSQSAISNNTTSNSCGQSNAILHNYPKLQSLNPQAEIFSPTTNSSSNCTNSNYYPNLPSYPIAPLLSKSNLEDSTLQFHSSSQHPIYQYPSIQPQSQVNSNVPLKLKQEERTIKLEDHVNQARSIMIKMGFDQATIETAHSSFLQSTKLDPNSKLTNTEFESLLNKLMNSGINTPNQSSILPTTGASVSLPPPPSSHQTGVIGPVIPTQPTATVLPPPHQFIDPSYLFNNTNSSASMNSNNSSTNLIRPRWPTPPSASSNNSANNTWSIPTNPQHLASIWSVSSASSVSPSTHSNNINNNPASSLLQHQYPHQFNNSNIYSTTVPPSLQYGGASINSIPSFNTNLSSLTNMITNTSLHNPHNSHKLFVPTSSLSSSINPMSTSSKMQNVSLPLDSSTTSANMASSLSATCAATTTPSTANNYDTP